MSDEKPTRHTRAEVDEQIQRVEKASPYSRWLKRIRQFGIGRYYDLNAIGDAQADLAEVDMRTWAGDNEMKFAIQQAREAMSTLERLAYRRYFDD